MAGEDVDGLDLNIYNTSTYIFIGISAIVVIISFFGCCGAWKVGKVFLWSGASLSSRIRNQGLGYNCNKVEYNLQELREQESKIRDSGYNNHKLG